MAKSNSIELSPLRSLDDFLLGSARFQLPNYRDMEKWGNRVVQNLLYYQTNYFLMSIIMILVVTVLHPVKMACGGLTILLMYALFSFLMNSTRLVTIIIIVTVLTIIIIIIIIYQKKKRGEGRKTNFLLLLYNLSKVSKNQYEQHLSKQDQESKLVLNARNFLVFYLWVVRW